MAFNCLKFYSKMARATEGEMTCLYYELNEFILLKKIKKLSIISIHIFFCYLRLKISYIEQLKWV